MRGFSLHKIWLKADLSSVWRPNLWWQPRRRGKGNFALLSVWANLIINPIIICWNVTLKISFPIQAWRRTHFFLFVLLKSGVYVDKPCGSWLNWHLESYFWVNMLRVYFIIPNSLVCRCRGALHIWNTICFHEFYNFVFSFVSTERDFYSAIVHACSYIQGHWSFTMQYVHVVLFSWHFKQTYISP